MSGLWIYYEADWSRAGWLSRASLKRIHRSIIILLLLLVTSGCQEQIVHDLSEKEANKVVRHLSESGMRVDKVAQPDGRWAIAVPRGDVTRALGYLDSRRILAVRDSKNVGGAKGSLIPSREEQRFRYERSISGSLEESLAAMPGVLEARVHLNLPDEDPLFGSRGPAKGSGSVLLVVDDRFSTNDGEISSLVGGAAGIPIDAVRVLKSRAIALEVEELPPQTVIATPVASNKPVHIPWLELGIVLGTFGLSWGGYRVIKKTKKRVVFALPKELQCEG